MNTIILWKQNTLQRLQHYYHNETYEFCNTVLHQLCMHIYGNHLFLLTEYDFLIKKDLLNQAIDDLILYKKPLGYILGSVSFLSCTIDVYPPILIPRSETEYLTAYLISYCHQHNISPQKILDLCSGSGCIGIALLKEFSLAHCDAIDISLHAGTCSLHNAQKNMVQDRYSWIHGDITQSKNDNFYDIIVANPPYISLTHYHTLDDSVKHWEEKHALTDGSDGSSLLAYILYEWSKLLTPHGILLLECDQHSFNALKTRNQRAEIIDSCTLLYDQYQVLRGILYSLPS